jgi:hypothetical protein
MIYQVLLHCWAGQGATFRLLQAQHMLTVIVACADAEAVRQARDYDTSIYYPAAGPEYRHRVYSALALCNPVDAPTAKFLERHNPLSCVLPYDHAELIKLVAKPFAQISPEEMSHLALTQALRAKFDATPYFSEIEVPAVRNRFATTLNLSSEISRHPANC